MKMKKLSLQKKNKIFHKNCLYENEKKCTGIEKKFFWKYSGDEKINYRNFKNHIFLCSLFYSYQTNTTIDKKNQKVIQNCKNFDGIS